MSRTWRATAAIGVVTFLACGAVRAEEASAEIRLQRLKSKDALVIVRAIAAPQRLGDVDEHTIWIEGTEASLALARRVVERIDRPMAPDVSAVTEHLADGTVIAWVRLPKPSLREAMAAVRRLHLQRFGGLEEPRILVMRDTAAQIEAALRVVRALEAP